MGSRVLLMYGALLLPSICTQFLFSMSMMKTVLMCACETGGGVWQEPKVATPASSGASPKIAMTRIESFMKILLRPPRVIVGQGYVAGESVSLVLSTVFRIILADRGAPQIF